jgi:ankyrin repeat protein
VRKLHDAAATGDIGAVKQLLEEGADVNAKVAGGWTLLDWAVRKDHTDVVAILKAHGATSLHEAAENGGIQAVKLLLDEGARQLSWPKDLCFNP